MTKKTTSRRERHTKELLHLFGGVRGREGGHGGKPPTSCWNTASKSGYEPRAHISIMHLFLYVLVFYFFWPAVHSTPRPIYFPSCRAFMLLFVPPLLCISA